MSTTSVRPAGLPLAGGPGTRLPTTRTRRPTFAALAVLLILVGALASAWLVYRSGNRVDVLVARGDIQAGHQMTADDFSVARVATDDAPVIIASAQENFIGTHAATSIPEGTLLNRDINGDTYPWFANGSLQDPATMTPEMRTDFIGWVRSGEGGDFVTELLPDMTGSFAEGLDRANATES